MCTRTPVTVGVMGRVVILVGPKGAGKTTIGKVLGRQPGVSFLEVERIFLRNQKQQQQQHDHDVNVPNGFANPAYNPTSTNQSATMGVLHRSLQQVEDEVRQLLQITPVVVIESTTVALVDRYRSLFPRVDLVRVRAPLERCLQRCRQRDKTQQIPMALSKIRAHNAAADLVEMCWSAEIDNSGADELDTEQILEVCGPLLCDVRKYLPSTMQAGTVPTTSSLEENSSSKVVQVSTAATITKKTQKPPHKPKFQACTGTSSVSDADSAPVFSMPLSRSKPERRNCSSSNSCNNKIGMHPDSKIDVFLRVRPSLPQDGFIDGEDEKAEAAWSWSIAKQKRTKKACLTLRGLHHGRPKQWVFRGFAEVFGPTATNEVVFHRALGPLLRKVLAGATVACFCYGHTAAGKTHTVFGNSRGTTENNSVALRAGTEQGQPVQERGLVAMALERLAHAVALANGGREDLVVGIRAIEIHHKKVLDLLDNHNELFVREDANGTMHLRRAAVVSEDGRVRVQPWTTQYVRTAVDAEAVASKAVLLRAAGKSALNDQSSRSHALVEVELVTDAVRVCRESIVNAESLVVPASKDVEAALADVLHPPAGEEWQPWFDTLKAKKVSAEHQLELAKGDLRKAISSGPHGLGGKLVFIDLAGAEHGTDGTLGGKASKLSKDALRESREINASLLALKECIRRLQHKAKHVPFRGHVLTKVLRQYLRAADCHTVMVGNIVMFGHGHTERSRNTLRYAQAVAQVASRPQEKK